MRPELLAVALAQALALPLPPAPAAPAQRQPVQRTITITDETLSKVPEIHVAADWPTTLVFATALAKDNQAVMLAQPGHEFAPPKFTDTSVILIPRKDLPANGGAALTVTLSDGNILTFKLATVAADVDLRVDVELKLTKRAAPDSPEALKTTLEQLRAQFEECQATSGAAGVSKIGALVLAEKSPEAVELRTIGKTDKQSRMLVTARYEYRLFGYTYHRAREQVLGIDLCLLGFHGASEAQVVELNVPAAVLLAQADGELLAALLVRHLERDDYARGRVRLDRGRVHRGRGHLHVLRLAGALQLHVRAIQLPNLGVVSILDFEDEELGPGRSSTCSARAVSASRTRCAAMAGTTR